ncbi:MAG: hypothetical protein IBX50_09655 [Marinospirillum sp.]|uniref:hypothetical protein n=1 Tax=Marinospirillum sp. TaxID=2183934 RepID=UPI001A04A445|nr:hypothetical protein [Marinospirillum sp.]MBE0506967.1 hypothetical protein [Marinospirillum sp.]
MKRVKLNKTVFLLIIALFSAQLAAEEQRGWWPLHNPWADAASDPEPPPRVRPYELPRFDEQTQGDHHTQIPPLQSAPYVDGDLIFKSVTNCYPEPSKFRLELELEGRYGNRGYYDPTGQTDLGGYYAGIVARMPLYSATELNREREREYMRRTATAETIGQLMAALAQRNHAVRELGLYSSLEARSQVRVAQGVVGVDEQVQHLTKVAQAQQALIMAETALVQHRLILVGQCDDRHAQTVNGYLKRITRLPRAGHETP